MPAPEHILGTAAWLIIPMAEKAEVLAHHWVHGDDEGVSLCPECADQTVMALIQDGADPEEVCVDGGYDWPEEDTCCRCMGPPSSPGSCGRLLQYTLIGRSGELDHFEALCDSELKEMSAESAHELLCVLDGCDAVPHYQEENEPRVLNLARRVITIFNNGVVKEIDGVLAAQIMRFKKAETSNVNT